MEDSAVHQRESFSNYLERKTVVDPVKEAEKAEKRRIAERTRAAELARRGIPSGSREGAAASPSSRGNERSMPVSLDDGSADRESRAVEAQLLSKRAKGPPKLPSLPGLGLSSPGKRAPGSTRRKPSSASTDTLPSLEPELPKLIDDDQFGSSPLERRRKKRWRELRFLHQLLKDQRKAVSGLVENLSLEGGIRRAHFIVNLTGYIGLDGWEMDPHFNALFDSFDISDTGRVDPREIECALRILERPDDSPTAIILWCLSIYSFKGADQVSRIRRWDLLPLLHLPCVTLAEEDQLRMHLPELSHSFERLTGDTFPASLTRNTLQHALLNAPHFCDEWRRQVMLRLPDRDRLRILREAAERAAKKVDRHEWKLQLKRADAFYKERVLFRYQRLLFQLWKEEFEGGRETRQTNEKADRHFSLVAQRKGIRYWRHFVLYPRARRQARAMQKPMLVKRCFRKWCARVRYFRILQRRKEEVERRNYERRLAAAEAWAARKYARERELLQRVAFWAIKGEVDRKKRAMRAAKWWRSRILQTTFDAWQRNAKQSALARETTEQRRIAEAREIRKEIEDAAREEEEAQERERLEAERKKVEQKAYARKMLEQRERAALLTAYHEVARGLVLRRAFQRQRVFQRLVRRGTQAWEVEKPRVAVARLEALEQWLQKDRVGKRALQERAEYVYQSVELVRQPEAPLDVIEGRNKEGLATFPEARQVVGVHHPDDPSSVAAVGDATATVGFSGLKQAAEENRLEQYAEFGMQKLDPWKLQYRAMDLIRVWRHQASGDEVGPRRTLVDEVMSMTKQLARDIALDIIRARAEYEIKQQLEGERVSVTENLLRHGYASVVQTWWRTYLRILRWRSLMPPIRRFLHGKKASRQTRLRKWASVTLQCAWRCYKARKTVLWNMFAAWSVAGDFTNMKVYYYNNRTGESRWQLPSLLYHLAMWDWHRDRQRRLRLASLKSRLRYWKRAGGPPESVQAQIPEVERTVLGHRPRRGQDDGGSDGESDLDLDEDLDDSPLLPEGGRERTRAEDDPPLLIPDDASNPDEWTMERTIAGVYYQNLTTGEVTNTVPSNYILCDFCRGGFAMMYLDEPDKLCCEECFLARYNKPSRVDTVGYVVVPGSYDSCYQAPDHCCRSMEQLFSDEFRQPFLNRRRAKPAEEAVFRVYNQSVLYS